MQRKHPLILWLLIALPNLVNADKQEDTSSKSDLSASVRIKATDFTTEKGFYSDRERWLAVNPSNAEEGVASLVFPYPDGKYDITLEMVGENDGQSSFAVQVEREVLGTLQAPKTDKMFDVGPKFNDGWEKVTLHDGDVIKVIGKIHSADGKEWSRARWVAIQFTPVESTVFENSLESVPTEPMAASQAKLADRQPDGDGTVEISGEQKKWHKITLTLDGPFAHEMDTAPNPFTDREMNVTFTHTSGEPSYKVPAYFAADGNAAESSADSGTKWRAHLSPDKTGTWTYVIDFEGTSYDGTEGSFEVIESDKSGRDLRGKGRLEYVGEHYLQFADSGDWFFKAGADAPETLLAYVDFDNTVTHNRKRGPLKTWKPHEQDWNTGDPTWQDGKGKGLIGAINYLSDKGANSFSFLTYNAGGDGDNVWPHVSRKDKLHFDCSKLDQWGIVFEHGTAKGMYLHFKLQETENDDLRGKNKNQALDGSGEFGPERQVYLRELVARYGHNLALNWNIGEENTQTFEENSAMVKYLREIDPYQHNIVLHTYPQQQNKQYNSYKGKKELLSGLSIQNSDVSNTHKDTIRWVNRSRDADHKWIVAIDEPGNAGAGTPPDPDYPGMKERLSNIDTKKLKVPSVDDIRSEVLWGNLMGGGGGVEYYFGYQLPENDLNAQDWRSRDKTWSYSNHAIKFFENSDLPFIEMINANTLVDNPENNNDRYCLAKENDSYVIYLRDASRAPLDLSNASGEFTIEWYNPREGGTMQSGSKSTVEGGSKIDLGKPPADPSKDWVAVVKRS